MEILRTVWFARDDRQYGIIVDYVCFSAFTLPLIIQVRCICIECDENYYVYVADDDPDNVMKNLSCFKRTISAGDGDRVELYDIRELLVRVHATIHYRYSAQIIACDKCIRIGVGYSFQLDTYKSLIGDPCLHT